MFRKQLEVSSTQRVAVERFWKRDGSDRGKGTSFLLTRKLPMWWAPQGCGSRLWEPKRRHLLSAWQGGGKTQLQRQTLQSNVVGDKSQQKQTICTFLGRVRSESGLEQLTSL